MRVTNSLALLGRRLLLGAAQQQAALIDHCRASSITAAPAAAAARRFLMLDAHTSSSTGSSAAALARSWSIISPTNCSCSYATLGQPTPPAAAAGKAGSFVPPPLTAAAAEGGAGADDAAAALPGRQRWHRRRQQLRERKLARREERQKAKAAAAADVSAPPRTGTCRRIGLPIGYKKLEFVLTLARRRHVDDALTQLAASPKRAAVAVRGAVANARHNAIAAGADPSRLLVERAWTGRAAPIRRPWFHGRGYSSIRQSRRTHLTVVVQEAAQPLRPKTKVQLPASMRPRRERQFPRPSASPSSAATAAATAVGQ